MQLCTYQKHHKHKIILFLSAMRSYRDLLKKNKIDVHYEELKPLDSTSYTDSLINYIKKNKTSHVSMFSIEDKWFEKNITKIKKYVQDLSVLQTPMFLTNPEDFEQMCPKKNKPKYKMTDFYINQRKKLGL